MYMDGHSRMVIKIKCKIKSNFNRTNILNHKMKISRKGNTGGKKKEEKNTKRTGIRCSITLNSAPVTTEEPT